MDKVYHDRLSTLMTSDKDYVRKHNLKRTYAGYNVGLYSSASESYIQIPDNGDINISTKENTGLFISRDEKDMMLSSERLNITAEYVGINTSPYGLSINGYTLNPQLYTLAEKQVQLKGTIRVWIEETELEPGHWGYRSVSIKPFFTLSGLQTKGLARGLTK